MADREHFAADTPDRATLWQIQTPQTFSRPLIWSAYQQMKLMEEQRPEEWSCMHITDDAMVAETFAKAKVKLIPGGYENMKITTPEDMIWLKLCCGTGKSPDFTRIFQKLKKIEKKC